MALSIYHKGTLCTRYHPLKSGIREPFIEEAEHLTPNLLDITDVITSETAVPEFQNKSPCVWLRLLEQDRKKEESKMKRTLLGMITVLLALLVMAFAATPAFAQSELAPQRTTEDVTRPPVKALGIRVPRTTLVGHEITVTAFERGTQKTVSGAGVWAIPWDRSQTLQDEINTLQSNEAFDTETYDCEALCGRYGKFLGKTAGHGELNHTFDQAGQYLLMAVKNHYYPGFARITVKEVRPALTIRAPRIAFVHKPVTMTVYERINWSVSEAAPNPVADAHIWAVPRDEVEALRERIAGIDSYESVLGKYLHLGMTDGNGQLTYTFREAANYVLVTWKSGYRPGFAPLTVRALPQVLAIRAPRMARIGDNIDMTICGRFTQQPIVGADVWAVSWDQTETLSELSADIRATGEAGLVQADAESIMRSMGATYLGESGNNGQLTCSFDHAGRYILVAFKDGYWPGFGWIIIRDLQPIEPMENGDLQSQIRPQVLQD